MNPILIKRMAELWAEVTEKANTPPKPPQPKKPEPEVKHQFADDASNDQSDDGEGLDKVDPKAAKKKFANRKDKDIDNDGDVDSSDEYLHKRRKAVGKAMQKEAAGEMQKCPDCGGSMENHEPDCPRAEKSDKKKLEDDLDSKSANKALKHDCATHVTSEQWGYGECISGQHTLVEQEDGSGVVTHYDVMFEHGVEVNVPVESLTIIAEKHHMHAQKKHKVQEVFSDQKAKHHDDHIDHHDDQARHHETQARKGGSSDHSADQHKVLARMHDRAQKSHMKAMEYHSDGNHEKAMAHSKIAQGHTDAAKKKQKEMQSRMGESYGVRLGRMLRDAVTEKRDHHTKGAHDGEKKMLDKFKGKGAQDMGKENGIDDPKEAEITPVTTGHDDASKAGRVTKQAKSRGNDNLGVGDKTPPKGGK